MSSEALTSCQTIDTGQRVCRVFAAGIGMYALWGGLISFLGWVLDVPAMSDWIGSGIAIQPNATLCVTFAGVGFLGLLLQQRLAAFICGLFVAMVGAATLIEWITHVDFGIDSLLLFGRSWGRVGVLMPGRMGPPGSLSWTLLGTAIVFSARGPKWRRMIPAIALITLAISSLSLIGYLYQVDNLFTLPRLTIIALQTATFIMALSFGLILLEPKNEPLRTVLSPGSVGILTRRALPLMTVLPILLGWLRVEGQRVGWIDTGMGTALLVLALIGLLLTLIWWALGAVRRHEQSLVEAERTQRLLLEINELGAEMSEKPEVLERICERLAKEMGVSRSGLSLINLQKGEATVEHDWHGEWPSLKGTYALDTYAPQVKADAVEGRNTAIDDLARDPRTQERFPSIHAPIGVGAYIHVPLQRNGRWIASFWATHHVPRYWTKSDIQLAETVGARVWLMVERMQAERAQAKYTRMLDSGFDAIVMRDEQDRIIAWNHGARALYGWSQEETLGQVTHTLFQTRFPKPLEEILADVNREGHWEGELVHQRKDGQQIIVFSRWSLERDTLGRPASILETNMDITARKRAENALLDAKRVAEEANAAKDNFMAVLSHELRTPLTPALATLSSWEALRAFPAELVPDLAIIRRNVELEARLIDDLLDLNRVIKGKFALDLEVLDVEDLLASVIEMYGEEFEAKRIDLRLERAARDRHVHADSGRLQQVFWNILKNALKFTPEGGHIDVRTSNDHDGNICIVFTDSGIGLSEEMLTRLFQPFEQEASARYGGLGLGLAITKRLLEAQHGKIDAQSNGSGQGASFVITLPCVHVGPELLKHVKETSSHPRKPSAGGRELPVRVLLIEDHADTALVLSKLLRADGHDVTSAGTVAEALAALQGSEFDILVSDIGLPDGTGMDLIRQAREQLNLTIPAVALTGFGMEDDIAQIREAGFDQHLTKPVNIRRLEETIRVANKLRPGSSAV